MERRVINVCANDAISDNANISYVKFMENFQELYDECIPKKRIKKGKVETTQERLGYLSPY